MEQGQNNTGKGKKGKKAKPEKVFMPVDKIHPSVVHILRSECEKKPADLNQQVGWSFGGRTCPPGHPRRENVGVGTEAEELGNIQSYNRAADTSAWGSTQVKFELD
ncbi:hypothetical protein B0H14DRAFT_2598545 [Mycena olivaceomarginata]|nr:hypothetical protein B0H14DRAFT_2598545 [Mycena olivaceomarginata]